MASVKSRLNPIGIFPWGYMKSLVYGIPVNTPEDLLEKVLQDLHISQWVRDSLSRKINLCTQVGGREFEILL